MFAPKVAKPQSKTGEGSTRRLAPHDSTSVAHPLFAPDLGSESQQIEPAVQSVVNEPGNPLDTGALSHFQTSFGHDFSTVRVHTDERAAASAASQSARAFTIGHHVVFGRGEYEPGTPTGRQLLGHELAHVVQQSRGGPSDAQSTGLEAAADLAASQALSGAPVVVAGSSAIRIACKTIFDEFTGGKYKWGLLKDVIEASRPVATIVADVNGLTAAEREQAITDIFQERVKRVCKRGFQTGQQSALTDLKDKATFDPLLLEGTRVVIRIDKVLDGLAPAGTVRTNIPGWNFTPEDYARLKGEKQDLTIAPDSSWFPAKLQENLLKTLAFVLGPTVAVPATSPWQTPADLFCEATKISPSATEGINAMDFFHGHLVIKKDSATDKEAKAAVKAGEKFEKTVAKERTKAIGKKTSFSGGYHLDDKKIEAYTKTLEKLQPKFTTLLDSSLTIPGAAVMYHTFEFNNPHDLKVKGQKQKPSDPRRHYVTPLDTNTPTQYTPPDPDTYEKEYHHVVRFSFLVDTQGAVHVRPLETGVSLSTLELSTITGATYPEPLQFEK